MGTILTASVIDKVQTVLFDKTGVRWDGTQILGYLNEGQRVIPNFKPNCYVKNTAQKLSAGTKQTLPDDAIQLIDVPRNMGTDGTTPGWAVRITSRERLDAMTPGWHCGTADAEVRHYMYSPLDPKHFYVYPPQPAANQGYVDLIYGAIPPDATINGTIQVDDIYEAPLVDYCLYRSFQMDTEYADSNRANTHFQAFIAALGGKAKTEFAVDPNATAPANTRNQQ